MHTLLNEIEQAKNELAIICNDGSVCINVHTFDFTYTGKFGQMVSNAVIKHAFGDTVKKLHLLNTFMDLYSKYNGGFSLTSK